MAGPMRGPGGPGGRGRMLEKPKNVKQTVRRLAGYLAEFRLQLVFVILGIIGNSVAGIATTYFLKPIINNHIVPFIGQKDVDLSAFAATLAGMAAVYLIGMGSGYLYHRLMINISTGTMRKIRTDLFTHMEKLPIRYFDSHTHG